jgi:uracil-DNA glycosylase
VDLCALDAYLHALTQRPSSVTVTNPYAGEYGALRLDNLRRYLTLAAGHASPVVLPVVLIGEAPGYRGCAVTGVPFTSRRLLRADLGRWGLFAAAGFRAADDRDGVAEPQSEQTATVVWRTVVDALPAPPIVGNAFPFHPHPAGLPLKYRPLSSAEVREGAGYLRLLLAAFGGTAVCAVGRQAERALASLDVCPLAALRHPAHGGAAAFSTGLRAAAYTLRG